MRKAIYNKGGATERTWKKVMSQVASEFGCSGFPNEKPIYSYELLLSYNLQCRHQVHVSEVFSQLKVSLKPVVKTV
jgi:hypothetical protein